MKGGEKGYELQMQEIASDLLRGVPKVLFRLSKGSRGTRVPKRV